MGKSHRDNHKARKKAEKRGERAFEKKKIRRKKLYIGPWDVTFTCGVNEYVPIACSSEIILTSQRLKRHKCHSNCHPLHFKRLA